MKIVQSGVFSRTVKKLTKNDKKSLDRAVRKIIDTPDVGQLKKGDLAGIRVYKFKCASKQYLLAYREEKNVLTLLALGAHENFYRNLKK